MKSTHSFGVNSWSPTLKVGENPLDQVERSELPRRFDPSASRSLNVGRFRQHVTRTIVYLPFHLLD